MFARKQEKNILELSLLPLLIRSTELRVTASSFPGLCSCDDSERICHIYNEDYYLHITPEL